MTPPELRNRLGPIAPNPAVEWYQAFSGEVFLMFALMFIIYGATDEKLRSGVYLPSLPIGCTVGVGIIFMVNTAIFFLSFESVCLVFQNI